MAKDNGGVAGDGVDSFVRSFAIEIISVNDAPSFRLLVSEVRMVQQRPPVEADDRAVLAQVLPAPLDERSQQLSFVVTFASSGCSAADFVALPLASERHAHLPSGREHRLVMQAAPTAIRRRRHLIVRRQLFRTLGLYA